MVVISFAGASALVIATAPRADASATREMPPDSPGTDKGPGPERQGPEPLENLSLSEPPNEMPRPEPQSAAYYPYRQVMTFRLGLASDFPKLGFTDKVLGFSYIFPKFLSPKLEAAVDLHESGRGHVNFGVRWIYFERSYFRPSVKISIDHFFDGKYGLGTLARKEDWYARGSGTIEYVVWNPYSVRIEAEMLLNFDHTAMVATLGVSRGW